MSKKMDQDVKALKILIRGCKASTPKMLRANLEFVCGKFLTQDEWDQFRIILRKP